MSKIRRFFFFKSLGISKISQPDIQYKYPQRWSGNQCQDYNTVSKAIKNTESCLMSNNYTGLETDACKAETGKKNFSTPESLFSKMFGT